MKLYLVVFSQTAPFMTALRPVTFCSIMSHVGVCLHHDTFCSRCCAVVMSAFLHVAYMLYQSAYKVRLPPRDTAVMLYPWVFLTGSHILLKCVAEQGC